MEEQVNGNKELFIDPETVDEYEAFEPFQRFMRVLIDQEMFPEAPLSLALLQYPPGTKCPKHVHEGSAEVYYVLEGELTATIGDKIPKAGQYQLINIPPFSEHQPENRGSATCRFLGIHAPAGDDLLEVKRTWQKRARDE